MTTDYSSILKELSELYDSQSKDTYVSVYFSKHNDPKFLEKRTAACQRLLDKDEQDNFADTIKQIKEYIKTSRDNNLALFASKKYNFLKAVVLPVEIHNSLVVDSSPYIRPLARIQDEYESFTLVLINTNYAKLYSLSMGAVDATKNLSSNIMNKHKKGGQSQARFQRLRTGAIHAFYKEVEEALENIADKQIILTGPGQAKHQFYDILPKHLKERIIDQFDISIDDEQQLLEKSIHLISKNEEHKSTQALQHLKAEILKDGLAVYGLDETLKAVQNGQVDLLLIEKDYKVKGCLCENCQILKAGPIKECPICGGPTTEADVIEEIIEFAHRTNAEIEFTSDEELAQLGHIGGILRYK